MHPAIAATFGVTPLGSVFRRAADAIAERCY